MDGPPVDEEKIGDRAFCHSAHTHTHTHHLRNDKWPNSCGNAKSSEVFTQHILIVKNMKMLWWDFLQLIQSLDCYSTRTICPHGGKHFPPRSVSLLLSIVHCRVVTTLRSSLQEGSSGFRVRVSCSKFDQRCFFFLCGINASPGHTLTRVLSPKYSNLRFPWLEFCWFL